MLLTLNRFDQSMRRSAESEHWHQIRRQSNWFGTWTFDLLPNDEQRSSFSVNQPSRRSNCVEIVTVRHNALDRDREQESALESEEVHVTREGRFCPGEENILRDVGVSDVWEGFFQQTVAWRIFLLGRRNSRKVRAEGRIAILLFDATFLIDLPECFAIFFMLD